MDTMGEKKLFHRDGEKKKEKKIDALLVRTKNYTLSSILLTSSSSVHEHIIIIIITQIIKEDRFK
jgi:ketopantoate reductase